MALPGDVVDTYFHSRGRMSQIGAAVSDQSRVLGSRGELEERVRVFEEAHPQSGANVIPRPAYWRGFLCHREENRVLDGWG